MKSKLLVITYDLTHRDKAPSLNTSVRVKLLKKIYTNVSVYNVYPKRNNFFRLIKIIQKYDCVCIRIDGSGCLDKYSLLKFFNPKCKLVWEIHGVLNEQILQSQKLAVRFKVLLSSIFRKLFSALVSKYIFISAELADFCFSSHAIFNHQFFVIPNFVDSEECEKFENAEFRSFLSKDTFIILWIGNPIYKWHAIDLIEKVAKIVYSIDRSVLFILIGGKSWHNFHWHKNIILLESIDSDALSKYLSIADICLALYNKNNSFPSYFSSLKILQYMKYKKAIIASNTNTIRTMIVNGKNGLITNNTGVDVSEKIILLKNNRKLRLTLGEQAFKTLDQNHDSKQALTQYLNLKQSL